MAAVASVAINIAPAQASSNATTMVSVITTTTAAAAYAPATLERPQTIDVTPAVGAKSCQSRSITLAGGVYLWEQFVEGSTLDGGQSYRNIRLVPGSYLWETCIAYSNSEPWNYTQTTILGRSEETEATLSDYVYFDVPESVISVKVTWGSVLNYMSA
ncbi:hypothetical protein ACWERV_29870 [Streptomyces sp. NPDC004031]